MQFKFAFITAALATLAVATPTPSGGSGCSTGPVQCCQQTTTVADLSSTTLGLLSLLGIVVGDLTNVVGLQCTSLLGGSCHSQAVCCENNAAGGLISIGCLPIQL